MSDYKINGVPVTREEFVNHKPGDGPPLRARQSSARIGDWKTLECEALAYEPQELPMAHAKDEQLGAPFTEYNQQTGAPIFRNKEHYNAYLKAHGWFNRTSGKVKHVLAPGELERAIARAKE